MMKKLGVTLGDNISNKTYWTVNTSNENCIHDKQQTYQILD